MGERHRDTLGEREGRAANHGTALGQAPPPDNTPETGTTTVSHTHEKVIITQNTRQQGGHMTTQLVRERERERLMAVIRLCEVTMAIRALEVVFACLCVCVCVAAVRPSGGWSQEDRK